MADQENLSCYSPYHAIWQFWGEQLSEDLVERIRGAPPEHRHAFWDFLKEEYGGEQMLPELPLGELRPAIIPGPVDESAFFRYHRTTDIALEAARRGLNVLLYAHQIVLSDQITGLVSDRGSEGARWLLKLKPLADAGIVHFTPPPYVYFRQHTDDVKPDDADLEEFLAHRRDELSSHLRGAGGAQVAFYEDLNRYDPRPNAAIHQMLRMAFQDMANFDRLPLGDTSHAHRLFSNAFEEALFDHAIGRAHVSVDGRQAHLRKLLNIVVPEFDLDVKTLAAVHGNEPVFAEWRHLLASSLEKVSIHEASDGDDLAAARAIVATELEPVTKEMEAMTKKSPALRSLQTGTRGFAVSALAASAAVAAGGTLASALTSAGVTKLLESVFTYLQERRNAAAGRAVLDLALTFRSRE